MAKKNKAADYGKPIPIRIPADVDAEVSRVSKLSRLSKQDVLRLSIERGVGIVEKMFEKPESKAA